MDKGFNEIYKLIFKEQFKYIPNISRIVDKRYSISPKIAKLYRFIKRKIKRSIKESVIQYFYDDPEQFFSSYKRDLNNTSLYDISGNSIFAHYFNVLNSEQNAKSDIYEKNFNIFFKELGKDLSIQDSCLDTPLHKLAKFKNKNLFFDICQKLKNIGVLNEELLTIKNVDEKSCYDLIIEDILENKQKIIQNNFKPYKDFIELFPNLKNSLDGKQLMIIIAFLSKVIIDESQYKEIGINETIDIFNSLLNNLTDKKLFFKFIYVPCSGINQLNILFGYCDNEDNFDALLNLVLELSKIKIEKEIIDAKKKYKTENDLYNQCIAQHINYVIRNMRTTKTKADLEINYGLKLLEKIIPLLIQNNKSEVSLRLIYEKSYKKRGNVIYNNKGLLSNLFDNQNIYLNQKIDIYKKYYTQLNLNLETFIRKRGDKSSFIFYFFINYDKCMKLDVKETNSLSKEKCREILDEFEFVGSIYQGIYILSHIYFKNDTNKDKFIQKLTAFFRKNYSDLVHNYVDWYGLSEEKQKLLFEFIIKFKSDYKANYYIDQYKWKKYSTYLFWFSKFILTVPELLYPFLLHITDEDASIKKITDPSFKEIAERLYIGDFFLTYFCRLFLILKYNFDDVYKKPEIIPFFNLSINKNYLNINKNEILNLFSSIDDKTFKQFCLVLIENPEIFFLFKDADEEESNELIESERIRINLNILQKISNDSKQLIENEKIPPGEKIYDKQRRIRIIYLIKLLKEAKKQNNSLLNYVKENKIIFFSLLYSLVIYYKHFHDFGEEKNLDLKLLDYIIEEINGFINYYKTEKVKFKENNLKDILIIFDKNLDQSRRTKFINHIKIIKQRILNNKSNIDFSIIEEYINRNIFFCFFFIVYGQNILNNESNNEKCSLDFSKYDKNIINFFFDKFLNSFGQIFHKKFYPIITVFYDFINFSSNIAILDWGCFRYIYEDNYNLNNFCFVMFYKYIITKYPNYNPFLLFNICELYLKEKNNKNYFELFYAIINDKSNESSIEKHLFLVKNEDIPKNFYNNIKQINKTEKTDNLIFNKLLVIFMNKYLIDMNYTKNSFVFDYLDNNFQSKNIDVIRSVIYNYPFFKNPSYSKTYFYKLISQLLKERQTIYEFLKQEFIYDTNIENIMQKRIKVLEHVFKLYSNENDPYIRDKTKWQYYIESNWLFGLFTFLKILKDGKKNLFLLSNNNLSFIKDTIISLTSFRKALLNQKIIFVHSFKDNISKEELDKKIEFVLQEIHEIFFNFLSSNEFISIFSKDINNKNEEDFERKEIIEFGHCIYDFVKYYNKEFYKNTNSIKMTKIDLNANFDQFQSILKNITKLPYTKSLISLVDFIPTLVYLFTKDMAKFYSLLTIINNQSNEFSKGKYPILLTALLKKNVEKFFANFEKIKSIIKCDKDWYKGNKNKENLIRLYILNNSIPTIYSKLEFINDIPPLKDSYKLLNDIKNKDSSLFMLKNIVTKYNKKNRIELILDIMENVVYNGYIIEYLFNSLKENDIKEFIKSGKYNNNIIKALFLFSQINGYLLIQKLLFLLKNYAPSFDLKALILPPERGPYENMVNLDDVFPPYKYNISNEDEEENRKEEEKDKKENEKMRYLLFYAFNFRIVNNYETIAVLLEYCPLAEGADFLIKELLQNNIDNLFKGKIKYIEYFMNPNNKNKIKELGKNFFGFINFIESALKQIDYISKLKDKEKCIMINYIKIFLLEIMPKELEFFYDGHNPYQDESKLFIILSLCEMKGNPILPIKANYPIFYSKIEAFVNKCKSLDLNPFSIKKESDADKLNIIKDNLTNDSNEYIIDMYTGKGLTSHKNIINLIKYPSIIETYAIKDEMILYKDYSIENLILNLLRNKNINPIYNSDVYSDDSNIFFSVLFDNNNELESQYKPIIDSLLDFTKSSNYVIQNQNQAKRPQKNRKKYDENNEGRISVYEAYLNFVVELCSHIISKSDNIKEIYQPNIFIENLGNQEQNKLNEIKKTINIEQIISEIFKFLQELIFDDNKIEFFNSLKSWTNEYLKKNEIMKEYNKLSGEKNILSYFKYLRLACFIILHFIEIIEKCLNNFEIKDTDIKHNYHYAFKKNIPKKEIIKAFNDLGTEIFNVLKNNYIERYNDAFETISNVGLLIPIYFYFNEEKEIFVEVVTEQYPYQRTKEKFIEDFIKKYYEYKTKIEFNTNSENKLKNKFYNKLAEFITNFTEIKIDNKNIEFFKKEFEPFYQKYINYIQSFFNNILEVKIYPEPSYENFELDLMSQFKNYFHIYLYPAIIFNRNLGIYLNNLSCYMDYEKINNDEIYINFGELIKNIENTKYHEKLELDALFKQKAINYIINGNSNINYFIQELYTIIYNKVNRSDEMNFSKKNIKEYFNIKIENGKKFDINEAKGILTEKNNLNKKEYKEAKACGVFVKPNSKFFYSIVCVNPFKRKLFPLNFTGNIPLKIERHGKTEENNLLHAFYNYTMTKDKNAFLKGFKNNKLITGVKYFNENNVFVNAFELMFSVKGVENNDIILQKNDVGKILKNYSNDDESFKRFANHNFNKRKNENVFLDWKNINLNWKYGNY